MGRFGNGRDGRDAGRRSERHRAARGRREEEKGPGGGGRGAAKRNHETTRRKNTFVDEENLEDARKNRLRSAFAVDFSSVTFDVSNVLYVSH